MTVPLVVPEDVVWAADVVTRALRPGIGRDWSVRAGRLSWDVWFTVTHMTALTKYVVYHASRSSRFISARVDRRRPR